MSDFEMVIWLSIIGGQVGFIVGCLLLVTGAMDWIFDKLGV